MLVRYQQKDGTRRTLEVKDVKPVDKYGQGDFFCGRGGKGNHHIGNETMHRDFIGPYKERYRKLPKPQKALLAKKIVGDWQSMGGRFLFKVPDGTIYEIPDHCARSKISQKLREKDTPKMQQQALRDSSCSAVGSPKQGQKSIVSPSSSSRTTRGATIPAFDDSFSLNGSILDSPDTVLQVPTTFGAREDIPLMPDLDESSDNPYSFSEMDSANASSDVSDRSSSPIPDRSPSPLPDLQPWFHPSPVPYWTFLPLMEDP